MYGGERRITFDPVGEFTDLVFEIRHELVGSRERCVGEEDGRSDDAVVFVPVETEHVPQSETVFDPGKSTGPLVAGSDMAVGDAGVGQDDQAESPVPSACSFLLTPEHLAEGVRRHHFARTPSQKRVH